MKKILINILDAIIGIIGFGVIALIFGILFKIFIEGGLKLITFLIDNTVDFLGLDLDLIGTGLLGFFILLIGFSLFKDMGKSLREDACELMEMRRRERRKKKGSDK